MSRKSNVMPQTPEERLRKIRSLLKQVDERIDSLPYMADQTDILRAALVDIAKYVGPATQPKTKKHAVMQML